MSETSAKRYSHNQHEVSVLSPVIAVYPYSHKNKFTFLSVIKTLRTEQGSLKREKKNPVFKADFSMSTKQNELIPLNKQNFVVYHHFETLELGIVPNFPIHLYASSYNINYEVWINMNIVMTIFLFLVSCDMWFVVLWP